MAIVSNERGFALVLTMLFAMIALALTGALLYIVTQGTKISGIEKRYATALEAARGAGAVMKNYLDGMKANPDFGTIQNSTCLTQKNTLTACDPDNVYQWTSCSYTDYAGNACSGTSATVCTANTSLVTSSNPKVCPDVISTLGDYKAYTKVIDSRSVKISGQIYNFYTVMTYSENPNIASESSQQTFLYRVLSGE
ncbi:MAG: hypothetical protein HQL01_08595 [Nitrospirae bacterium]|uniref:Type IV pilus assembly protein PilX n=1 Tax=uncultured Nitrospirae bacterium MY3-5B TaxID=798578 RepID=D9MP39_9BACT|nr:hypothetical protein LW3_0250 [uncultured Nitrospirae bacterium MY3-5B]MBF0319842.1 hypothetical protein [Nitrospirota bacterium]